MSNHAIRQALAVLILSDSPTALELLRIELLQICLGDLIELQLADSRDNMLIDVSLIGAVSSLGFHTRLPLLLADLAPHPADSGQRPSA